MRIALFTDTYLPEVNGAVTSIDSHTRLLGARGHEILIICPKYRMPILHVVPHVTIKRYRSFSLTSYEETRVALPSIASVARALHRFKPDLVHIHTPLSIGVVGLATARMLRLPIVQTYHTYIPDFMQYVEPHRLLRLDDLQDRVQNSLVFEQMFASGTFHRLATLVGGGRPAVREIDSVAREALGEVPTEDRSQLSDMLAWQFTRTVYNRGQMVLTPSMTLKRALEEHGVSVPVECLSNGIDTALIRTKECYKPTGRLLHVGRLGFEKNVDAVVRAFAILAERHPELGLDILGDGPARESLQRLVERLGLEDRIRFRGFIDRHALGKVYRNYDAFLTASTIETQGIVLLEAMTAGLPVVGVRALAIPELVAEGRCGLLVDPGNERAFADAIEVLAADQGARERMGAACRERASEHDLSAVVTRLEGIYDRVLEMSR